jgi:hypothetical protein
VNKKVFAAVLITYLVVSFVPSLGLMSLVGKGRKGG